MTESHAMFAASSLEEEELLRDEGDQEFLLTRWNTLEEDGYGLSVDDGIASRAFALTRARTRASLASSLQGHIPDDSKDYSRDHQIGVDSDDARDARENTRDARPDTNDRITTSTLLGDAGGGADGSKTQSQEDGEQREDSSEERMGKQSTLEASSAGAKKLKEQKIAEEPSESIKKLGSVKLGSHTPNEGRKTQNEGKDGKRKTVMSNDGKRKTIMSTDRKRKTVSGNAGGPRGRRTRVKSVNVSEVVSNFDSDEYIDSDQISWSTDGNDIVDEDDIDESLKAQLANAPHASELTVRNADKAEMKAMGLSLDEGGSDGGNGDSDAGQDGKKQSRSKMTVSTSAASAVVSASASVKKKAGKRKQEQQGQDTETVQRTAKAPKKKTPFLGVSIQFLRDFVRENRHWLTRETSGFDIFKKLNRGRKERSDPARAVTLFHGVAQEDWLSGTPFVSSSVSFYVAFSWEAHFLDVFDIIDNHYTSGDAGKVFYDDEEVVSPTAAAPSSATRTMTAVGATKLLGGTHALGGHPQPEEPKNIYYYVDLLCGKDFRYPDKVQEKMRKCKQLLFCAVGGWNKDIFPLYELAQANHITDERDNFIHFAVPENTCVGFWEKQIENMDFSEQKCYVPESRPVIMRYFTEAGDSEKNLIQLKKKARKLVYSQKLIQLAKSGGAVEDVKKCIAEGAEVKNAQAEMAAEMNGNEQVASLCFAARLGDACLALKKVIDNLIPPAETLEKVSVEDSKNKPFDQALEQAIQIFSKVDDIREFNSELNADLDDKDEDRDDGAGDYEVTDSDDEDMRLFDEWDGIGEFTLKELQAGRKNRKKTISFSSKEKKSKDRQRPAQQSETCIQDEQLQDAPIEPKASNFTVSDSQYISDSGPKKKRDAAWDPEDENLLSEQTLMIMSGAQLGKEGTRAKRKMLKNMHQEGKGTFKDKLVELHTNRYRYSSPVKSVSKAAKDEAAALNNIRKEIDDSATRKTATFEMYGSARLMGGQDVRNTIKKSKQLVKKNFFDTSVAADGSDSDAEDGDRNADDEGLDGEFGLLRDRPSKRVTRIGRKDERKAVLGKNQLAPKDPNIGQLRDRKSQLRVPGPAPGVGGVSTSSPISPHYQQHTHSKWRETEFQTDTSVNRETARETFQTVSSTLSGGANRTQTSGFHRSFYLTQESQGFHFNKTGNFEDQVSEMTSPYQSPADDKSPYDGGGAGGVDDGEGGAHDGGGGAGKVSLACVNAGGALRGSARSLSPGEMLQGGVGKSIRAKKKSVVLERQATEKYDAEAIAQMVEQDLGGGAGHKKKPITKIGREMQYVKSKVALDIYSSNCITKESDFNEIIPMDLVRKFSLIDQQNFPTTHKTIKRHKDSDYHRIMAAQAVDRAYKESPAGTPRGSQGSRSDSAPNCRNTMLDGKSGGLLKRRYSGRDKLEGLGTSASGFGSSTKGMKSHGLKSQSTMANVFKSLKSQFDA